MSAQSQRRERENGLLFAVAQSPTAADSQVTCSEALDWDYVLDAANLHGISPLLFAAHRRGLAMPERAADAVRSAYWITHFRNQTLLGELGEILNAAETHGIALMPLKGALLAPYYYPTPALRPMSDLDLLVGRGDMDALAALLVSRSHTATGNPSTMMDGDDRDPFHRERAFVKQLDGVPILIECRIEPLDPGVMAFIESDSALSARLREHVERMWARGRTGTLDGAMFTRLSPEDLILHVASHLTTRHANFRLLWLHDLCRIATRHEGEIDWSYVAEKARALRLNAPIFAAMQAAHDWLGAPIPVADLRPAFVPRRWAARAPVEAIEYGLLMRQVRAMRHADLTTRQSVISPWLILVSFLRLRGARAPARALRSIIVPSRPYMQVWSDETAHRALPYHRALLLRGLLTFVRMPVIISSRCNAPWLSRPIRRLTERIAAPFHLSIVPGDRRDPSAPAPNTVPPRSS